MVEIPNPRVAATLRQSRILVKRPTLSHTMLSVSPIAYVKGLLIYKIQQQRKLRIVK